MSTIQTYTGKGHDELYQHVQTSGALHGEILRTTGHVVSDVSVTIENGLLILRVNGVEYSSITSALQSNYDRFAVNRANGSEGSGDIANNIIGNYAILKHVVFGNITLDDIVGGSESRGTGPRAARVRKEPATDNRPVNEVFFNKYTMNDAKALQTKFGRDLVTREFNILTLNEFEMRFGL